MMCGCTICLGLQTLHRLLQAKRGVKHRMIVIDLQRRTTKVQYARNTECVLWASYEGANDWKICQLLPDTVDDEKGAQDSIQCVLNALEARMSLMIREGEVGAVGTTDNAAMGYYVVKWTSEPYALQADAEGMSGVIADGAMVVDAVYFNRVERAPYWYTQSELMTVVEVRHVLWSGLQLKEISATNKLPLACNRLDATRKRAGKIAVEEHEAIMEEAERHDRLEYNEDEDPDKVDNDDNECDVEGDGNSE